VTTFPVSRDGMVQFGLLFLVGALVFGALAFWRWYRRREWRRQATSGGILGALATLAFALAYTVAPVIPTFPAPFTARFAQNPTPDTPETVAAGRALYGRFCAVCHGPRGLGDGPQAIVLNPRPFDLRLHVPQHAQGEHLYWISEGIRGTAMPAFKDSLSETERWQLVRYLYALAAGNP
jgi:mono/diheme cytochrome c family protein